jgi:hypothetical protein
LAHHRPSKRDDQQPILVDGDHPERDPRKPYRPHPLPPAAGVDTLDSRPPRTLTAAGEDRLSPVDQYLLDLEAAVTRAEQDRQRGRAQSVTARRTSAAQLLAAFDAIKAERATKLGRNPHDAEAAKTYLAGSVRHWPELPPDTQQKKVNAICGASAALARKKDRTLGYKRPIRLLLRSFSAHRLRDG